MGELKFPEVNRVFLSGRLTRDPDLRFAADGTPVTSFTIAFHRRYRARDGRFAEQAGFVPVVTYQRLAEVCGARLHKGDPVLVEGRLQMREWAGRSGGTGQRLAEVCAQYLRTGSPVLVEGRLQMREWTTTRGEKRQSLEVRAESVHFLEKVPAGAAESPGAGPAEDPTS